MPLVEGVGGEDTASRNTQEQPLQKALLFVLEDGAFPKLRARTRIEGEVPTHMTDRGPHSLHNYTTLRLRAP